MKTFGPKCDVLTKQIIGLYAKEAALLRLNPAKIILDGEDVPPVTEEWKLACRRMREIKREIGELHVERDKIIKAAQRL